MKIYYWYGRTLTPCYYYVICKLIPRIMFPCPKLFFPRQVRNGGKKWRNICSACFYFWGKLSYKCVHTYICTCTYMHVHKHTYMYMYICMYAHMYLMCKLFNFAVLFINITYYLRYYFHTGFLSVVNLTLSCVTLPNFKMIFL